VKAENLIPTWRDDSACLSVPTELFFPAGETGSYIVQAEQAKAICARCPVRMHCLRDALEGNEAGVWGGLTERERRALKNKLTREQYATVDALYEVLTVELPACGNCGAHRKEKADGMCATCVSERKKAAAEQEKVAA
jgi:WhiB family redox-sensing transcriptional regulator